MVPPHEDDAAAPPDPTAALHPEPPQASPSVSPTRIPKKTTQPVEGIPGLSPPVPLSQNGNRSNSFDGGANEDSLCLPDGIQLPPTVTPGMIDGRLRRAFFDLTPSQMREVLTEFDDAVRDKGGEIRNHTAYLFGVVKRYKTTYGDTNPIPQGSLSDKVLMRLDALVTSGFCSPDDLDLKIKDRMRMLSEKDALDSIDEINGCSRGDIRNFASYFMGIMNRYMRGERQNPLTRGSNRVRDNRQHEFHGANDDRFSHYGRNDNPSGRDGRGDGRERHSSRDGDGNRRRRRRSRSRSRSPSWSRSRSRSPDYRRRRRSRSGSNDRHHSRRHDVSTRDLRSNNNSLSVAKPYGHSQPLTTHTLPPPPPPPPPRPPQTMMQPMTQRMTQQMTQQLLPGQPSQMMMPGGFQGQMQPPQQQMHPTQPQQQFMQPLGQISQPGQGAMSVQMQQQLQQQQLQQQQLQQQQLLQQYLRQYQQVPGANMPQQMMPQLNQVGMIPGSQVVLTNSMLLGQPAPGTQPVNSQSFVLQSQNQGQPPLDIFHLADKAAQALSGRQFPQVNAPAPMSNPNFPPMPAPSASQGQSFQQNMTSEADLPRMVQYAVQNLRVTGHIETALDAPLCGMLKRLPENAALKALEVFSSCELSKMRNKGAYLSGILKKELIKLGL